MAKKNDSIVRPDPIALALEKLEGELGSGAIREGIGDSALGIVARVDVIPTGSLSLDVALGVGGIPRGRMTEIYGPEGGGKTTLALHLVANVQKSGGRAVFIDVEHAVDISYAQSLGIDTAKLLFSQPDSAEQAFKIIETMAATGKVDVIVLDSVAALATQQELEGDVEDVVMAGVARFLSKGLKRIVPPIKHNNVAMIFINQVREKVGPVMGSRETTPGGRALKFYASIRMAIRRIQGVKDSSSSKGVDFVGNVVKVDIKKNKVAPPFRSTEFEIIFGKGINTIGCIVDLAVQKGLIERRGSNHYIEDKNIANSRSNMIKVLEGDSVLLSELENNVRKIVLPHLLTTEPEVSKSNGEK